MKYTPNVVYRTKSGLLIRRDRDVGLLVYSPYTGLIFIVHPKDMTNTLSWMNCEPGIAPGSNIHDSLGYGWDETVKEGVFPNNHYLADQGTWNVWHWHGESPILVNWFLTGNCPLACRYCDAEDLMRNRRREPVLKDVKRIASAILSYNPLAVVLTGGEPLLSPHLDECIKRLYGRTGIIVDTNGVDVNEEKLELFKKYEVVVRISMDSPIPERNDRLRSFGSEKMGQTTVSNCASSLKFAFESLCSCLNRNIPVSVQTVATRETVNDLPSFGERLYRLGLRSWRIHLVLVSKANIYYRRLFVPIKTRKHIFSKLLRLKKTWKEMDVQILDDISRNSVVIVSTDGEFLTESNTGTGKIPLDPDHPFKPEKTFWNVNPFDHARRYLNLSLQLREWFGE